MTDPNTNMDDVRDRVLNRGLFALILLGFPAVAFSLLRSFDTGWHDMMYLHAGAYGLLLAVAAFRQRLPFPVRAFSLLTTLFVVGIADLLSWGLSGLGIPILLAFCLITAVLLGTRPAIVSIGLALTALAAVGAAAHYGVIRYEDEIGAYSASFGSWLNAISGTLLLAAVMVAGFGGVQRYLMEAIERLHAHTAQQMDTNRRLEDEIAERKRTEDALRESEDRLRHAQKMEAVGQLAGGVAHDFNNLLQAIQGYTELAIQRIPPDAGAQADLEEVSKAAKRATALVRQLLTFSRHRTFEPAPVDLNAVAADLHRMLEHLLGAQIELTAALSPGVKQVAGDSNQIEQVLLNLCVNARDAMPAGGEIRISTENTVVGRSFIEQHPWAREGEFVLLTVSDTGTGMPPEVMERIFEPFFTTKETGQGTGLGLATVYGIVKQHDGMITVDSTPGQGTTFRIYFPAAELETALSEAGAGAGPAEGGGRDHSAGRG